MRILYPCDLMSREQLRFDTNRIVAILKEHEKILVDGFDQNRICKMKLRRNSQMEFANKIIMNSASSQMSLNINNSLNTPHLFSTTTTPIPATSNTNSSDDDHNRMQLMTTPPPSRALVDVVTQSAAQISSVNRNESSTPLHLNLEFKNAEQLGDIAQAAQVKTCEDLLKAGYIDNKVYTVEIPQEDIQNNRNNNENNNDNENDEVVVGHDFRHRLCDQQTSGGGWTVKIKTFRHCLYCLLTTYNVHLFSYFKWIT